MKKTIKQQIDDLANTIPEPYRTELLTKNPYPPNPEDCKMELCTEYSPACLLGICKKTVMQKGDW